MFPSLLFLFYISYSSSNAASFQVCILKKEHSYEKLILEKEVKTLCSL